MQSSRQWNGRRSETTSPGHASSLPDTRPITKNPWICLHSFRANRESLILKPNDDDGERRTFYGSQMDESLGSAL